MFKLFNLKQIPSIRRPVDYDISRGLIKKSTDKVIDYHRNKTKKIYNSQFAKFITSNMESHTLSDIDFLLKLGKSSIYNTIRYHFSSFSSRGSVINDNAFNTKNLIVTVDASEPLSLLNKNWEELTPLKPYGLTNTDISLRHPTDYISLIPMLNIRLDPIMLLFQYKKFIEDRVSRDMSTDVDLFLYQYPLTNIIPYLLDNAVATSYLTKTTPLFIPSHNVTLPNYKRYVHNMLFTLLDYDRVIPYADRLYMLQLYSNDNGLSIIPDRLGVLNRNNYWAELCIDIPVMHKLFTNFENSKINTRAKNELKIFLRMYDTNISYHPRDLDGINIDGVIEELREML